MEFRTDIRRPERPGKRSPAAAGLAWAALLTAVTAQALFWLPLGYREPEPEERPAGRGVGLLSRRAFGEEAACRRFLFWMERHDPVNFLKSGARGGFSALLPRETEASPLPERRPAAASPAVFSAALPVDRERERPAGKLELRPGLLPPSPSVPVGVRREPGRPRLLRADGSEFDPAGTARWNLPDYAGRPRETLLAVGGEPPFRRMELLRSSGVAALDRLALAETTRLLAAFADGEVLAVGWPERDAGTEKESAAP